MNQEIIVPEVQYGRNLADRRMESGFLIEKNFPWIIGDLRGLAGYQPMDMEQISLIVDNGLVPPLTRWKDVFATDCYSLILRGVQEALQDSLIPDFNGICEYPLRSRLETAYEFPDLSQPVFDAFAGIAEDGALGRHALPMASLWINAAFGASGFKVFVIGKEGREKMLASATDGNSGRALREILENQARKGRRETGKPRVAKP